VSSVRCRRCGDRGRARYSSRAGEVEDDEEDEGSSRAAGEKRTIHIVWKYNTVRQMHPTLPHLNCELSTIKDRWSTVADDDAVASIRHGSTVNARNEAGMSCVR
jgi:hypothetical protein